MSAPDARHVAIRPDDRRVRILVVSTMAVLAAALIAAGVASGSVGVLLALSGIGLLVAGAAVAVDALARRQRLEVVDGTLVGTSPRFAIELAEVRRVSAHRVRSRGAAWYALRLATSTDPEAPAAATVHLRRYRPDEVEALFLAGLTARTDVVVDPTVERLRAAWRDAGRR